MFSITAQSQLNGELSENIIINSKVLGYSLQFRVYTPKGMKDSDQLSTMYIVDGQWYLEQGQMAKIIDKEITDKKISPIIAIFIDNRDPYDLEVNRRNYEFFCNEKYISFFKDELIPEIDNNYPTNPNRLNRVIQGVSFGGYNAACFGILANDKFAGISMHSPANAQMVSEVSQIYKKLDKLPLKIFLSVGNQNDNQMQNRTFRSILKDKGYDLQFKQSRRGHGWDNWKPLIDDTLRWFYSTE